ncbi:phosphatidylinositol kinase [Intrasporangium oryzae NRRL B-24470]|uniref:Phosphatidylinositol kinase n=1 Tax=Intrasporangium oryzae NRRL B-24470 TaxID=1386089 RepID=W9GHG7_9MICO|nr:HipA domain-containing protein [Intrasporangium oryzae]EWT03339.1 phosphatidylinositol kinase [Intrasporangium oryzae NRRL B-24470]
MQALAVWLYDTHIADLHADHRGRPGWTWSDAAYGRWGSQSRVVSHLLPVTSPGTRANPARVRVFLDGLLPEGNARTNYALSAGVAPEDTFGLISAYGRDTAGALVFQGLAEDAPDRTGSYERATDPEVATLLREADRHSPADHTLRGNQSISLAGMIPKIGLHRDAVGWLRCLGGAPSTWILKIAHPETSPVADVVDTEALALALARSLGLTTVDAHVLSVDGVRAIAVSRYDRKADESGRIRRVHQEDSAQALSISTADPTRKFQYGNALPSLSAIAEILRAGGAEPDDLLRLVTFNVAIGNTDMHAKNISVLRLPDGSARLAPAYDTSMHLHHPTSQRRFGFDIDGESDLDRIDTRALVAEGRSWRLPERRATELVTSTLEGLGRALDEVDRAAHPGVGDGAVETVAARVSSLLAGALTVAPAVRARRGPRRRST